jgi:transcriptional regulator with XRE-family HTH domain
MRHPMNTRITLKRARQRKRWSQAQLAAASHVDQGTISRLEKRGTAKRPTYDTVAALAKALEVDAASLTFTR